jgi:hypothetical protein
VIGELRRISSAWRAVQNGGRKMAGWDLAGKVFGGKVQPFWREACLLACCCCFLSRERSAVLAVLLLLLIIYPWTIVVEETILLLPSMIC